MNHRIHQINDIVVNFKKRRIWTLKLNLTYFESERLLLVTFQTSFYGNFDFLGN